MDKNIAIYGPAGFRSTPSQVLFLRWCVCVFFPIENFGLGPCVSNEFASSSENKKHVGTVPGDTQTSFR